MSILRPFVNHPMNSPQSLDREPLSNSSANATSSPRKEIDLTEVDYDYDESDDDEDSNTFHIRGRLSVAPVAQDRSIQELHSLIHEGSIYLSPPYQRDVVWASSKQTLLIDSIFRNFYIPPVVFSVTEDDGVPVRVCVDGKQRLTSIQRFLDGQLPYVQSKRHYYFTAPESMKNRLQIPKDKKDEFLRKTISCVEYSALTPEMEREIFNRVQLGMPLTAAEKWAAIISPWAEWVTKLESRHVSVEGGLAQLLDWDDTRKRDFQNVAHIAYVCDGYPGPDRVPTASKMENWLKRVDSPGEQFKQEVDDAMTEFCNLASDNQLNFGFNIGKKIAPVEFVYIGALLYVLHRRTSKEKAQAVHILRTKIREQFPNQVRLNKTVGTALWTLIHHLKHNPTRMPGDSTPGSTTRRRRKLSTSDDDEYRDTPVKGGLGKGRHTRSRLD